MLTPEQIAADKKLCEEIKREVACDNLSWTRKKHFWSRAYDTLPIYIAEIERLSAELQAARETINQFRSMCNHEIDDRTRACVYCGREAALAPGKS